MPADSQAAPSKPALTGTCLLKEPIQHSSPWKVITLLRHPVTQGMQPNSSSNSLLAASPPSQGASSAVQSGYSMELTMEWEGSSQLQGGTKLWVTTFSFVPKATANTNHFIQPGEGNAKADFILQLPKAAHFRTICELHPH